MTSSLRELQHVLADALRRDEPLALSAELAKSAETIAKGNRGLSPVEQVDVYREQFFLRHVGALDEDFPGVHALVGCDAFDSLARAYLAAHPPRSFTLRDLGVDFAEFLADVDRPDRELLADMARFEWALVDAFDAEDVPPIDPAKLQAAGEEVASATLAIDPSVTLLELAYPVHRVRPAIVDDEPWEPPAAEATWLVVNRRELALDWNELDPLAYRLLSALRVGVPLGRALDAIAATLDEAAVAELAANVGGWFATWVSLGIIRDLSL